MAISTGDHWQQHVLQIWWCYYVLTLLDVQQASKPIEVAKDISTTPVDTAQGMSSNAPDLAQKEVAIKPLDTTLCVSSHAPDLTQKEVAIMPVDTAQGMSSNAPDLVQKKVAIQPAPLLQETALPPLQKQEEGQALTATDVCQKPEMGEFPIPLQAKPDDCQDQLAQQSLPQPPLQEQGRQDLTAIEDRQEPEIERSIIPQSPPHVQGQEHLRPLHDGAESLIPPELGDGNQDGQLLLAPIPLQTSKEASRQEPEIERSIIPQSPPHEHGPEDLRPLHDGAGSPQPPEVGVSKQDGEGSPPPPEFEVGNPEGQLVLAPIPVEANRDAVCQDQLVQQSLLNAPVQQQGDRHAMFMCQGKYSVRP